MTTTGTTTTAPSRVLAGWASTLRWQDLPDGARSAARRTLANVVGLGVGAADHPAVVTAMGALGDLGAAGDCSVLGRAERFGITWAPLVNGIAMHVEDFDDTHLRTVLHPGAPVVAAALSVAESTGASGAEVLTAVAAGVEVSSRVGNGICPGHFDLGWHVTGTMGHLGAAVAAGRLLGLDPEAMHHALALAATQAAGHTQQLGTMTKSLHPGKAAADGVEAALLAAAGFTGPDEPIEGRRGLAALMAPEVELEEMLRDLGSVWELEDNAFKPYACGIVSHPVIDAGVALREQGVDPAQIASVEVVVRPVVLQVMGVEEPQDGLQSKFSVYHCFAVGLLDGAAGPAQYSDERATDAEVVALRRKVRAVTDQDMPKDACRVEVVLQDGTTLNEVVDHATGSVERPMSDEQLRAKFELVVRPVLGERTGALWEAAFGLADLPSVAPLLEASRPA
ncbi:MmgE/PrpD family protein [Blastococcus saxobsidens]|uniref:2-methylcitrate dehydratase PrpD n=1 Tax=Blastococcus saxobsidens TaxID=138336 RepID=A0A4Q7YD50_9ACTN|nr:MmgE/PrpD family protein [Blastococcus saxobsidens]RZU34155.1 2-methylcitrate dehydratase PrpD [Blastococcus saxobsidens]